jgi:thiamine biosynthesis lipoprotein
MMRAATEWTLWSTTARLVIDHDTDAAGILTRARTIADRELAAVDAAINRFRPDSELNLVEDSLPYGVIVSPELALFVRRAVDAAMLTDGSVDPAVRNLLTAIGYDRDIHLIEDDGMPVRAVISTRPPWRSIRIEDVALHDPGLPGGPVITRTRLTVPQHLALDLGATAKALAADLVARAIADELGVAVLLSLGGDVSSAGPEPDDGWQVRVQDGPAEPATTVRIAAGSGLATSSTLHRAWTKGGARVHHIVDPATGLPAQSVWRTASVAAESCFVANAMSTAAIVRGPSAPQWLAGRADARLVATSGDVLTVGRWPAPATAGV